MRSKKHVFHWHCLEVVQKKKHTSTNTRAHTDLIWSSGGFGFGGTERQSGFMKSHRLLAAGQVTGDDITVPWWPWKEPIMCPCPIQLAASHCSPLPLLHFHPSIPQEERELPLRLASFGPGSWNREPFIGHSLPLKAISEFRLPGGRAQLTGLEWVRDS